MQTIDQGMLCRWRPRAVLTEEDLRRPLVERVLAARGIVEGEQLKKFLNPTLHLLHDAALLPGMAAAAARVLDSLKRGGPVVIYGDYDVDGITATAILYHTFRAIAPDADVRTYVPHRLDEGYGLNVEAIEQIAAQGADLIITVDCGITAVGEAARAKELGVDLIITDHHLPNAGPLVLPDAFALVHPRLPGSKYPFGDLCGAGVAFKLAWRLATMWCGSERVSDQLRQLLMSHLALAALGTIADVVPLVDENRIIAKYGLRMMRDTNNIGLNALITAAGLDDADRIDCEAVGFRLAPRLNAAGRMGHAREAVRLFTTDDPAEALQLANQLEQQNRQRQATERAIVAQAREMAQQAGMTGDDRRIIILAHEDWHAGVVGIVCSRLVEQFHRPVVLMQRCDDVIKGSARSIEGYSIHGGLAAVGEHLLTHGGHDMAAGLALAPAEYDSFVEALTEHANRHIEVGDMVGQISYDCEAVLHELDQGAARALVDLGPFGRSNPRPQVLVRNLRLSGHPRVMGDKGRHLSLQAADARGGREMRFVGWSLGWLAPQLASGMTFDAVVRPKLNSWNGRVSVEGELSDVRAVR